MVKNNLKKLIDNQGNTILKCPSGYEYLNDLSTSQINDHPSVFDDNVDDYMFFLMMVKLKIKEGYLEDKDSYTKEEIVEANRKQFSSMSKQEINNAQERVNRNDNNFNRKDIIIN